MSVVLSVVMEIPGKDPREFEYEFDQLTITMGREEDNDIQIPLSTVSRNHARIYSEGGEWFIEDLRSTHGTSHNGKPLGQGGKKLLRNGDTIEVVHFKITFSSTADGVSNDYSAEHTEALARRMVEEVLATIGDEETPYLLVMNGPDEGNKFDIPPELSEAVVGRGVDADFQINDANISRKHAVVRRDWKDITVEDLGSKNGVVINDKKINKMASLRDSDEIILGAVRLTFIDPSAKFLGKLDDIPAFASEETEMEEEEVAPPDDEEEEVEAPVLGAGPDEEGDAPVPDGEGEGPDGEGEDGDGEGEGEDGENDDEEDAPKGKKLGAVELALIAAMLLMFLGIGAVVAVILLME